MLYGSGVASYLVCATLKILAGSLCALYLAEALLDYRLGFWQG